MLNVVFSFKLWNIAPSSVRLSAWKYVKSQISLCSVVHLPFFHQRFCLLLDLFIKYTDRIISFLWFLFNILIFFCKIFIIILGLKASITEIRLKWKFLWYVSQFKNPRNLAHIVLYLSCFLYFLWLNLIYFIFLFISEYYLLNWQSLEALTLCRGVSMEITEVQTYMSVSYSLVPVLQYSSTVHISLFGMELKRVNDYLKRYLQWRCSGLYIADLNVHH